MAPKSRYAVRQCSPRRIRSTPRPSSSSRSGGSRGTRPSTPSRSASRQRSLVGGALTVADLVAAYTLDMATVGWAGEAKLLDGLPSFRQYTRDQHPTDLVRSPEPGAESAHRPGDGATC